MNHARRLSHSIQITVASLLLGAGTAYAGAADLELFATTGALAPNIMILLDTSGSMDDPACFGCETKRVIAKRELKALVRAINDPDGDGTYTDNARFGLMGFRSDGAVLQHAIQSNATAAMLTAIDNSASTAVGTPISAAALDIMRYLAGPTEPLGTIPAWGNRIGEDAATWNDPWDLDCRKTYVVYISDGLAGNDNIVLANYWATIGDADGEDGETSTDVGSTNFPFGDDITAYTFGRDFRTGTGFDLVQNITTHVIGFAIDDPYLENIAEDGGGTYYTTSAAGDLSSALTNITTSVYDDQATFSTAVVPTSRTLFGAAFYNAYFKPDANAAMWAGHLESYGLLADGTIVESDGVTSALDPTGLFNDPADPYWDAADVLASDTLRAIYTNKLGSRIDFTTANITSTDLAIAGATGVEIARYPNSSTSDIDTEAELRTGLIRFLHGKDGFDDDDNSNYTEMRDTVLGDIFHSSPRIVGSPSKFLRGEAGYPGFYSANVDRKRTVYVGANDGMLHAFGAGDYNLGDDISTTGVTEPWYYDQGTGDELFGFIPGDMLAKVKNVPLNGSHSHYFVDGSPSIADVWLGDGTIPDTSKSANEWSTVLVTGMREGGDSYLALDITDPDAAGYPGFMWEFTDADLGQTWSEPVITRVKVTGGLVGDLCGIDDGDGNCIERWVAIFGGGYTPNDEGDPNSGTFVDAATSAVGRAIYVVALDDGSILAKASFDASDNRTAGDGRPNGLAEMKYAIPSTPTVLDLDFDGFADVIYVGDLGGQVWKWDISAVAPSTTPVSTATTWPIGVAFRAAPADLGSGVDHYRNFFFPPSASFSRGSLMLAFGSGERQDLRRLGTAGRDDENRFYVVRDRYPTGLSAFDKVVTEDPAELDDITLLAYDPNTVNDGYYIVSREGEKFVNDFSTFAGYVQATSYIPTTTNPCTAASGESFIYQFRIDGGQGLYGSGVGYDEQRRSSVGAGMASSPRVSMAMDPALDKLYIKTSKGKVLLEDTPPRDGGNASMIYWKQNF